MDISYDYYRVFDTVAACGSLTRAAELLGNNQPNVSRCMNRLEGELGCRLLVRSNRGIALTPEGRQLYGHVRLACGQLRAGEEELAGRLALESGSVSVAASETALHVLLLRRLREFRRDYPGIRLRLSNHSTPQALAALRSGEAEAAVVTTPTDAAKPLREFPLAAFREVLVGGPRFADLRRRTLTLAELSGYPLICLGRETMIRRVREQLVSLADAREQAVAVLTPSVTVALNEIILGQRWTERSAAYVSPYEHNAVLRPLELLRRQYGFPVRELPLAPDGSLDLDGAEAAFRALPPTFVAVSAVSNVTGYITPAAEIFRLAKPYGAFTLLDAAQAMGLVRMRFAQLRADAVAFAGHKTLYGPFGAGGFLLRSGAEVRTVLAGGTGTRSLSTEMPGPVPDRLESGSKDTVALAGLDAALGWLRTVDTLAAERSLTEYLLARLPEVKGIHIYAAPSPDRQAGVVSLNIDGFRANEVAALLDDRADIAVRAGHHCAARIHAHLDDRAFDGTVRVSLGYFNTRSDIDALIAGLGAVDREQLKGIDSQILRGNC